MTDHNRVRYLQVKDFSHDEYVRVVEMIQKGEIPYVKLSPARISLRDVDYQDYFSLDIPYGPGSADWFQLNPGELVVWYPRMVWLFKPDNSVTQYSARSWQSFGETQIGRS